MAEEIVPARRRADGTFGTLRQVDTCADVRCAAAAAQAIRASRRVRDGLIGTGSGRF